MEIISKIIKIIFDILIVLLVLLVIILAYNFFQMNILNKKYADIFGYTAFEVTTGSMSGTIEISDVILVKITQDVGKGDIITFNDNEDIVTHRIIDVDGDKLATKGDANNSEDRPVERKNVIGKVEKVIPRLGVWVKVFSDTKVIISVVVTIILFGIAASSEKEKKTRRRKNGETNQEKKD